VIKGHTAQVNVIIGLFSRGENDFSVYNSLVDDLFSEKLM
jgi:hypothetical protein